VWDASLVLGKYLEILQERKEEIFTNKKVLELGSGCGVTGITAAVLGGRVTISDWAICIPLLKINAEQNQTQALHPIKVSCIKWGKDNESYENIEPPYDYILAADVLYQKESIPLLLSTMYNLSDESTKIFMSFERHNEVADYFMSQVTQIFAVEKIPYNKLHSTYRHPKIDVLFIKKK